MGDWDVDQDHDRIVRYHWPAMQKRAVQELQGIATAVIFDGAVDDGEIDLLVSWLNKNQDYRSKWPLSDLWDLMAHILQDGVVTQQERLQMFAFLSSITKDAAWKDRPQNEKAGDGLCDPEPIIEFPKRSFVFTGRLTYTKRKDAQGQVQARGGLTPKSAIKNLSYLIIGDLGSPAWRTSKFGTKIEKVMDRRRDGEGTIIAAEDDFVKALVRGPAPKD